MGYLRLAADDRVDAAADVIDAMGSFYPIAIQIDAYYARKAFNNSRFRRAKARQFEAKRIEPDYLCFLAYAHTVLDYVHEKHPEVEKVVFAVEQKGVISRYLNEFHSNLYETLKAINRPELAPLVGALTIADKEHIPCQAADVLCWHAARFEHAEKLKPEDEADARRYLKIRDRKGVWFELKNDLVAEMAARTSGI